jgi:hypothetical protein
MITDYQEIEPAAQFPQRSEDNCAGGTVPSNTVPPNTILNYGIDSLYLSYRGSLTGQASEMLRRAKEYACDEATKPKAQVHLHGEIFKVHDKGKGKFKYVISNDNYFIQLSDRKSTSKMPFAMVQISSECLAKHSPHAAVEKLKKILVKAGVIISGPNVSRVDLYADIVTPFDFASVSELDFVTRAVRFSRYTENQQFSGFTFGMGGELAFRLYDKTLEIKFSHKTYFHDIWSQGGWNGQDTVWRLEFEIKREAAKGLAGGTFEGVQKYHGYMWRYLTHNWLRLVLPDADEPRRERLETSPIWQFIQNIPGEGEIGKRLANPNPSIEKHREAALRFAKTSLTNWMACGISNDIQTSASELFAALKQSSEGEGEYEKERNFEKYILHSVAKKRREFGTVMNSTSALTPKTDDENA